MSVHVEGTCLIARMGGAAGWAALELSCRVLPWLQCGSNSR
jgi:hypothetical protein